MLNPQPAAETPKDMPAEFGLATATFIIVASMVGTGILTTSGYTVQAVGSNQLMIALWALGGVVAAAGALTLCELSAALPRTGGDYLYLNEAYGPLVAFLSGWVSFVLGFAGPSAAAAGFSTEYLCAPMALDPAIAKTVQRGIATVFILLFAWIHTSGRRQTSQVQGIITAIKLLLLVVFMFAGLYAGRSHITNLADRPPVADWPYLAMMFSMVYIAYGYTGWNAASYLAGEFVSPQKLLPRAILLGTLGVVLLYVGLNVVYALALSASEVKAIDNVAPIAELAASRLFGARWSGALSVAFGLMLLSSLSAYLLTGPRVIYAMAIAGQFPAVAGRLTSKTKTPWVATVMQTALTLMFLWMSTLAGLLQYASVGLSIFSMLAVSSIYVLRWRQPDLPRPFRTPGYPITPALFLIPTAVLTAAAFSKAPLVSSYALLSIVAGVPFYYVWKALQFWKKAAI